MNYALPLAAIEWGSILNQIGTGAVSVLVVPVVLFFLPKIPAMTTAIFSWLDARAKDVKNQYASGVLQRLSLLVQANVLAAEQTRVIDLKAMCDDGKITPDELKTELAKVKTDVLQKVKDAANAQKLWEAALFVFAGNEGDLSKWVDTVVEAHVASLPPTVSGTSALAAAVPAASATTTSNPQ